MSETRHSADTPDGCPAPSRRSEGARGNVRRPPALRIDGATRPLPTSPPPSVLCAACPARQGKAIMDVLPARAPVIKQIFDSPIGYRIFRKGRILPDLPWARATIGRWRTTTHTGITAGPDQRAERDTGPPEPGVFIKRSVRLA